MKQVRAIMVVLLASSLLSACSIQPVYKPNPVIEYQHPYPFSQTHQALPVPVTQLEIDHTSDIVDIKSEPEFVFWSSSVLPLDMVKTALVESSAPNAIDQQKPSGPSAALINKPAPKCKKIFCDTNNTDECGSVSWCGTKPCSDQIQRYYNCEGANCYPLYLQDPITDEKYCGVPVYTLAHPLCFGKGELGCNSHKELFQCFPQQPKCTD